MHVVLDNLSAHSTPEIAKWLAHKDRRRWHFHYTPTSSSWLNLIERRFKELTDKRLRRGTFTSVADLTEAITTWAAHWNTDPKPFIWKATADDIIAKVQRDRATLHQIEIQTHHQGLLYGTGFSYWSRQLFRDGMPCRLGGRNLDPTKYERDRDLLLAEVAANRGFCA